MRTRFAAALLVTVIGASSLGAQRGGNAGAGQGNTPGTGSVSSTSPPAQGRSGIVTSTTPQFSFPPGWGMAPGPASTVNNPGGIPRVQPSPGIQPIFQGTPIVGRPQTSGGAFGRNRGTASRTVVVPIYVPVPVMGYGAEQYTAPPSQPVEESAGTATPASTNYRWVPDRYVPSTPSVPEPMPSKTEPSEVPYALLAFKDHSIYVATDYWLENNRLQYVTNYGASNSAALDLIDMDLTIKLNEARGVKFDLRSK